MNAGHTAWFAMLENTTHTVGSGAAISERPDQEVGLNKTRNCPRNRVRYTRALDAISLFLYSVFWLFPFIMALLIDRLLMKYRPGLWESLELLLAGAIIYGFIALLSRYFAKALADRKLAVINTLAIILLLLSLAYGTRIYSSWPMADEQVPSAIFSAWNTLVGFSIAIILSWCSLQLSSKLWKS